MEIFKSLNPGQKKATIKFPTSMLFWYYCFSLRLVNGGNASHFLEIKCSSRHTFAPIDSIFFRRPNSLHLVPMELGWWRPAPSNSNQRGGPLPPLFSDLLPVALRGGPHHPLYPLCASPWAAGFIFLHTPGVHGAKSFIQHFVNHLPIFSHTKLLSLF